MKTARLRGPAFVVLLSLSACANIWGFDDLRTGEDDGGDLDVTTPPEHDATTPPDAPPDQATADHTNPPDVDHADVVHDARPDVDSSIPDAHDADVTVPDAHDADADVAPGETGPAETGPADTGPDVMDVAPAPDANDANDSTAPETGPDVTVEAAVDSTVTGTDVTASGTVVTSVAMPTGTSVISDGIFPPVDSTNPTTQFDTNDGTMKTEDFVGYTFATSQTFTSVVFQDGIQSLAGGFFTAIDVQVEDGTGAWTTVAATVAPAYAQPDGHNFETFTFTLTPPAAGVGIRVDGTPGGTGTYVSVGELRVFAQ